MKIIEDSGNNKTSNDSSESKNAKAKAKQSNRNDKM